MRLSWLALAFVAGALSAQAAIELVGYGGSGETRMFALVDSDTGKSGWARLGESFSDYRLMEFASDSEILTVTKGEEKSQVRLRAASFSLPGETTGSAREKQFFDKLTEMQRSLGPGKKLYLPEDYMATATRFGRVVVSHEIKDGVDTIVMELPPKLLVAPAGGEDRGRTFTVSMHRRDKTRVKLTIR
ncbi:MAG: hypothetical protein QM790_17145 [Nibricoccus sp.]